MTAVNGKKTDSLGVLSIPSRTIGIVFIYDSLWVIMPVFSVRWALSVKPLIREWYEVVLNM